MMPNNDCESFSNTDESEHSWKKQQRVQRVIKKWTPEEVSLYIFVPGSRK